MSRGGTFMRPGAMAWGHGAQGDPAVQDPVPPAAIEDALATAVKDPDRVTALLDELSRGRLWLPLPDASPVTDGSAVLLPTVTYLGAEFVPRSPRPSGWPAGPAGWRCRRRRRARASGSRRGTARSRPCRTSWSRRLNSPGGCRPASASR